MATVIPKLLVGTTLLASSGVGNLILVSAIQSTVYLTTTLCLWGLSSGVKMVYRGSKTLWNNVTSKTDQSTNDYNIPIDHKTPKDPNIDVLTS